MNTDQLLFKELDRFSGSLRGLASELAGLYKELPAHTPEVEDIITALKKVETCPINHIDVAINEFKDALLILNLKMNTNRGFLEAPELIPILEKNNALVHEVNELEKKALELNSACED